ncbi:unnamed protein product [Parascedosporium putredinis]|uniref:DUF1754-domain-containing protein n=1 Tax=Parascedosporium putredinis TaxID=1442378 RepID=A0A9P1M6I1_9PEZI|nr:unnamed protein product [Parascedosporium putredinis]CAI7987372.1 unnamed protein product [Parascedosporium putredinis]
MDHLFTNLAPCVDSSVQTQEEEEVKDKDKADLEKALSDSAAGEDSSSALVTKKSRKGDRDSADDDRDDERAVHVTHKTEAQRKLDEVRRKRFLEMAENPESRPELLKTHKERVEELNSFLSKLSEHNDMPKIGPG